MFIYHCIVSDLIFCEISHRFNYCTIIFGFGIYSNRVDEIAATEIMCSPLILMTLGSTWNEWKTQLSDPFQLQLKKKKNNCKILFYFSFSIFIFDKLSSQACRSWFLSPSSISFFRSKSNIWFTFFRFRDFFNFGKVYKKS